MKNFFLFESLVHAGMYHEPDFGKIKIGGLHQLVSVGHFYFR